MIQKAIAQLRPELAAEEQESAKPVSIRMLMDAYRCTMVTIAQVSNIAVVAHGLFIVV
jgi:hypothetical protein